MDIILFLQCIYLNTSNVKVNPSLKITTGYPFHYLNTSNVKVNPRT